jgi:hypothetical protein
MHLQLRTVLACVLMQLPPFQFVPSFASLFSFSLLTFESSLPPLSLSLSFPVSSSSLALLSLPSLAFKMGCCSSHAAEPPSSLPLLPPDIIQITPSSPPELITQAIEVVARSFAGTTTTAPEGGGSWTLDPTATIDNDPSQPLKEPPTPERIAYFHFISKFCLLDCLIHHTVFALIKNGEMVGATFILPPSERKLHVTNDCMLLNRILFQGLSLPSAMTKGKSASKVRLRLEQCGKLFTSLFACLIVIIECQKNTNSLFFSNILLFSSSSSFLLPSIGAEGEAKT